MDFIPKQFSLVSGANNLGTANFEEMFEDLPIGVLVTDADGYITYYNTYQSKMDSMDKNFVIGRHVTRVYGPDPGPSPVMICLEHGRPIVGYVCIYRTAYGKMINSSHYIYPFFDNNNRITGCICYIQNFSALKVILPAVSSIKELGILKNKPLTFANIIGRNLELQKSIRKAYLAAQSPSPVLLYGETGTGKEMFASSIHQASSRQHKPFVAINCAAIPENLLEGILFGTSKGAFTGAIEKKGLIEEAQGGTIFLDEIDSMPLSLQPKLLRVLQEKKVRRVAATKEFEVDIKIISATSCPPLEAIQRGKLRQDLFYRLGVVIVYIPPLRNRIDDLEDLVTFFIIKYNTLLTKKVITFNYDVIKFFKAYDWPGNIRELEHLIEGALNMAENQEVLGLEFLPEHLQILASRLVPSIVLSDKSDKPIDNYPNNLPNSNKEILSPTSFNFDYTNISTALKTSYGNISLAAKILGVSRQLLSYYIKKYDINKGDFKIKL
ncbi:MAG: sigma 54-interacting transcriptional regulator [Deltaproteobacteria bacterium]|jgi:arginine utilization regulatory protein|nr:sigma 54-interacting transcriptional regulator [Deltaproteobacteria bacterium]